MAFDLQSVLKALLFSSGHPLSIKDVQAVFTRYHESAQPADAATEVEVTAPEESAESTETAEEAADEPVDASVPTLVTAAQIREAMDGIAEGLKAAGEVYLLTEGPQGYRIVTHPRFARWIRALRDEPPPAKLSPSALETLAVIAYRQPVTRSEIEAVRGVSADAGLNKLLDRELIYITGRAELPGRPMQYGTTEQFLEFVGVKSLVELPASDVLTPRQIDEWLKNATNPSTPGDAEMGLPLEEGEGETPLQDEAHIDHVDDAAVAVSEEPAADAPEQPKAES